MYCIQLFSIVSIAQLGERKTEDLKVPGSIPGRGNFFTLFWTHKSENASQM